MTEALQQEIRTLKNIFESERDPEGRVFAPLADAYRRAGEIQQAVRLLNTGLARHPDFVPGHVVAAQLYVEQGLEHEAAIAARNALALDAENVNAMGALLRVLEGNGDAEAEEVRSRLTALDPGWAARSGSGAPAAPAPAVPPPLPDDSSVGSPVADDAVDSEADTIERKALGGDEVPPALQATAAVGALPTDLDEESTLDEPAADAEPPPLPSLEDAGGAEVASEAEVAGGRPDEQLFDLSSVSIPEAEVDMQLASGLAPVSDDELPTEEPVVDLDELPALGSDAAEALTSGGMESSVDELPEVDDPGPTAFEEPVMELSDLGPDDGDDAVAEFSDLAPADGEVAVDLAELAPDETDHEPVMELSDLAPGDTDDDATVMDLDALAPDATEAAADPVVELSDLAPQEPAPAVDLADLAPDEPEPEPAVDLADLAPDLPEPEPAVDLAELAPDEPEPVMDLGDLAPDEPEPAVDLAELAPDEPVMELSDLAPTEAAVDLADLAPEPADDEPVVDLGALAPDEPEDDPVVELTDLAPEADDKDDDATVMSLDALAPDEAAEDTAVDLVDLAPDEAGPEAAPEAESPALAAPAEVETVEDEGVPVDEEVEEAEEAVTMMDLVAQEGEERSEPAPTAAPDAQEKSDDDDHTPGEPIYTRTLAELYVKQGAIGQAIEVYKHLGERSPDDATIRERLEELESGVLEDHDAGELSGEVEEEVETLARELAETREDAHDQVESPYTLHEGEDADGSGSDASDPSIGDYFRSLLGWRSEKGS